MTQSERVKLLDEALAAIDADLLAEWLAWRRRTLLQGWFDRAILVRALHWTTDS